MIRADEVEIMALFRVLLMLAGMIIDLVAIAASISLRVRMALPLPVQWLPVLLHLFGLIALVVGAMMMFFNNS